MTFFAITGHYHIIICTIVKNEVAFQRNNCNLLWCVHKYKGMKRKVQYNELKLAEMKFLITLL